MKQLLFAIFTMLYFTVNAQIKQVNTIDLFPLDEVHVTDGQMKTLQELSHKYLLTLEPDRLLSWFRREAGLTPKAQPYPLWESDDFQSTGPLAGHITGFYLSGMAMMYQSTGDNAILDKLNYTIDGLRECQNAQGDGYLLATRIGRHVFEDVVDGNFTTSNPMINDTWEPVYIMNKIMLGLYDVYTLCGINEAKNIVIKMADWFGTEVINKLDHDNIQKMLYCEHGSINESFVNVYLLTGDKKYLHWAERLNDEVMWIPLSRGEDILKGWHANTQIPKFTGFISVGRNNGDDRLLKASRLFFDIVLKNHTWVNGGNSCGEHFFDEDAYIDRVKAIGGPESCNSVNMMRLTEAIYQMDGGMEKVDYYEKVLLNHILGNFDPEVGMSCYYTSMRPGQYKVFADPYKCFWCCVGTGLQAPAKLAKMVYAHHSDTLFVNMFVPTTLNWKERDFALRQSTAYPDENQSVITIERGGQMNISIRLPYWSEATRIKVNGKNIKTASGTDYMVIKRNWAVGDKIEILFTPSLYVQPLKSFDEYVSVQYGAYVMATKIDNHGLTYDDFVRPDDHANPTAMKSLPLSECYTLVGPIADIKKNIHLTKANNLTLHYADSNSQFDLIPFTRILMDRYEVYFPRVGSLSELKAETVKLNANYNPTREQEAYFKNIEVDRVKIGDSESERKHKIESYRSNIGTDFGQKWRDSFNGGFYMYEMKCLPDQPMKLAVRYRQDDSGDRVFDILVDGKCIKTVNHNNPILEVEKPLYYEEMAIPTELTRGKNTVTIKFSAHNHSMAGGIFDIRILKLND